MLIIINLKRCQNILLYKGLQVLLFAYKYTGFV